MAPARADTGAACAAKARRVLTGAGPALRSPTAASPGRRNSASAPGDRRGVSHRAGRGRRGLSRTPRGRGLRSSSPSSLMVLRRTCPTRCRLVWRLQPARQIKARSRILLMNATGIKPRVAESVAGGRLVHNARASMPGFNFDVRGLIRRRILAKEISALVLQSNYGSAWSLLQDHPTALGVTAPDSSAGAGYGLLHTCLVRNTPDWFMSYVFNRTAVSVCVDAAGVKTQSTALHLACSSSWVRVVEELAGSTVAGPTSGGPPWRLSLTPSLPRGSLPP